MTTPSEYLEKAASYIGISGTDNIFNTWYWGMHVYDPNTYPWCAAFQSYVGVHDLGMPFQPSASASGVAWQGTRVDDSDVQPGDWVLFNWDGRQDFGWADHIGVVEWSDINGSGYFGTIEGNTGWTEGGEVARQTRYNNGSYATAFFRPPYDMEPAPEPEPEPEPEQIPGEPVNDAQMWYRAHVQDLGWCDPVRDGQVAGTVGFGKRLEALKMTPPEGWVLDVAVHVANVGWKHYRGIERGVKDPIIGTVGKGNAIESVLITVTARPNGDKRKLKFRVHQAETGWKAWTKEGFASGSDGLSIQLEAIQIKIV